MLDEIITIKEINEMLVNKDYLSLRSTLSDMMPADIAALCEELPLDEMTILFRILSKDLAAECFVEMRSESQQSLIEEFSDTELSGIISELFVDDTVDIIEEMPANVVRRILSHTGAEMREQINTILGYPKDSAGSVMTTEYVNLKEFMTMSDVFTHIKRSGVDKETVYDCYVTDSQRRLIGVLSLKDMIIKAEEDTKVSDIMERDVISSYAFDDKADAAEKMKRYGFFALPVIDKEERLVGIITADDAVEILEDEVTEDIEIMAGMTPSEKTYFKTSVFDAWKQRTPWLLFLMISGIITSNILLFFEEKLTREASLIAFMPLLMSTAGNAGGQVSVTVIRGLSVGEIKLSEILRVLWKEMRVSVTCAVTVAAVNMLKMYLFDDVSVAVALTVSVTMAFTVVFAKLIGGVLPFAASKLGIDPALMASPLVATVCDVISLLIYILAATFILHV